MAMENVTKKQLMKALETKLLEERQERLDAIARIDEQLAALGAEPLAEAPTQEDRKPIAKKKRSKKAKKRKKAKKGSVSQAIYEALKASDEPMRAPDIAEAIKDKGVTKSKNLPHLVRVTLPRVEGIKRVDTGLYTAK
jgi:septal ring factor EnvC (AmiA/AmiB activator)